jgi:hypothetical protein
MFGYKRYCTTLLHYAIYNVTVQCYCNALLYYASKTFSGHYMFVHLLTFSALSSVFH